MNKEVVKGKTVNEKLLNDPYNTQRVVCKMCKCM